MGVPKIVFLYPKPLVFHGYPIYHNKSYENGVPKIIGFALTITKPQLFIGFAIDN